MVQDRSTDVMPGRTNVPAFNLHGGEGKEDMVNTQTDIDVSPITRALWRWMVPFLDRTGERETVNRATTTMVDTKRTSVYVDDCV